MDTILLAAALLPAAALMAYVYSKDKVEPEPLGLVLRVAAFGALSGLVAGFVESVLIGFLEASVPPGIFMLVVEYFICVAAVEEACKYFSLNTVKRRPEFDYVFDAVVYAVAAALGFAALENVFYVMDGGLEVALLRAVLSVPGHASDGVVMGVFYGLARQRELHGNKSGARSYYWLAFLLPTIEHGFYDCALSTENDAMALLAIAVDLAFIILAFILVRRVAAKDAPLHPLGLQNQAPFRQNAAMPQSPATMQQPQPGMQKPAAPWAQPTAYTPPAPASVPSWTCPGCGNVNSTRFCPTCGTPRP